MPLLPNEQLDWPIINLFMSISAPSLEIKHYFYCNLGLHEDNGSVMWLTL